MAALSLLNKEVSGLWTDIKSSRDDIRDFISKLDTVVARVDKLEANNADRNSKMDPIDIRVSALETAERAAPLPTEFKHRLDDIEQTTLQNKLILSLVEPLPSSVPSTTTKDYTAALLIFCPRIC